MSKEMIQGLIAISGGIFSIVCAAKDFDFFMNNHKAKFFVDLFGRNGARIFYGILGATLVVLGVLIAAR